jgi:hypothetical protein
MGVAMYGKTAAGYGRPRPNYLQKIWSAAASVNMYRIKCHALLDSTSFPAASTLSGVHTDHHFVFACLTNKTKK